MVDASVQCSLLPAPPLLSVSSFECNSVEFDTDQEDVTTEEAILILVMMMMTKNIQLKCVIQVLRKFIQTFYMSV